MSVLVHNGLYLSKWQVYGPLHKTMELGLHGTGCFQISKGFFFHYNWQMDIVLNETRYVNLCNLSYLIWYQSFMHNKIFWLESILSPCCWFLSECGCFMVPSPTNDIMCQNVLMLVNVFKYKMFIQFFFTHANQKCIVTVILSLWWEETVGAVRLTCGCSVVSGDGRQAFAPNRPGRTLAPTPWQTSRPGWPGNHIIS